MKPLYHSSQVIVDSTPMHGYDCKEKTKKILIKDTLRLETFNEDHLYSLKASYGI